VHLALKPAKIVQKGHAMSTPQRVGIGLAGLGRMGRIHARNLTGYCTEARLSCVYDVSAEAARQAADQFGVPWVHSYDELLARFASGALGVIDNSRACGYGYECSAEIVGTRATARIGAAALRGCEWRTPGAVGQDLVTSQEERQRPAYAAELDGFARRVLDRSAPEPSGAAMLAAFDLAEAAAQAWRSGQTVAVPADAGGGYAFDREEAVSGAEGPA
jgi:predicted dehydrogenase